MFPAESNEFKEFDEEQELDAFDSQFEREDYKSADDYFGDSFDDETDDELMEEFNRKVAA